MTNHINTEIIIGGQIRWNPDDHTFVHVTHFIFIRSNGFVILARDSRSLSSGFSCFIAIISINDAMRKVKVCDGTREGPIGRRTTRDRCEDDVEARETDGTKR